jgi:hypothetical protein
MIITIIMYVAALLCFNTFVFPTIISAPRIIYYSNKTLRQDNRDVSDFPKERRNINSANALGVRHSNERVSNNNEFVQPLYHKLY